MSIEIRIARSEDASRVAALYAPIVEETAISFELTAPDSAEMARRIETTLVSYPWLVADRDRAVAGYAYGSRWRRRPAYDWSVEVTVVVGEGQRGLGVGRALYSALTGTLAAQGFVHAVAVIAVPNEASIRLHKALGFREAGSFPAAGFKKGAWRDLAVWWLRLSDLPAAPRAPIPFSRFRDSPAFSRILKRAT